MSLTVLAGKVTVATETLVGVGIDRHEQAEEIAEPTYLERQVGRAMGVGPLGGGGGDTGPPGGGGDSGEAGGGGGPPGGGGGVDPGELGGGGGFLLSMRAAVGEVVGI